MIQRAFPNIISADLPAAKAWFCDLVDFETEFDSDWFVHLRAAQAPGVELGIIAADHEIAAGLGDQVAGVMPIGVVDAFEVIDIEKEQGDGLSVSTRTRQRRVEVTQDRSAIRKPGQVIVSRVVFELALEAVPVGERNSEAVDGRLQ